jgi:hypothetical protein
MGFLFGQGKIKMFCQITPTRPSNSSYVVPMASGGGGFVNYGNRGIKDAKGINGCWEGCW